MVYGNDGVSYARTVFCHLAVRDLGATCAELARMPGLGASTASKTGFDHRFGHTISVRAEVSKHERGCSPFDTSGRTDIQWAVAETMIKAARR